MRRGFTRTRYVQAAGAHKNSYPVHSSCAHKKKSAIGSHMFWLLWGSRELNCTTCSRALSQHICNENIGEKIWLVFFKAENGESWDGVLEKSSTISIIQYLARYYFYCPLLNPFHSRVDLYSTFRSVDISKPLSLVSSSRVTFGAGNLGLV